MKKLVTMVFTSLVALVPSGIAFAQTAADVTSGLPKRIVPACQNGVCGLCDFATLIQNLMNVLIVVSVVGSALLFAYAGFILITKGDSSSDRQRAGKIFMNVIIGVMVILAAWFIVDTLMKTLTGGKFGPWKPVCGNIGLELTLGPKSV